MAGSNAASPAMAPDRRSRRRNQTIVERLVPKTLECVEVNAFHRVSRRFARHAPTARPAMNAVTTSPTCR